MRTLGTAILAAKNKKTKTEVMSKTSYASDLFLIVYMCMDAQGNSPVPVQSCEQLGASNTRCSIRNRTHLDMLPGGRFQP